MKNKELIKELSQFNKDADVSLLNSHDILISYVSQAGENTWSKKDTPQIFIEENNLCESCFFHDGGGYCTEYGKPIEDVEECFNYMEM